MSLSASGLSGLKNRNQDDAAVHKQDALPDENATVREARAATALAALARLMGRQAARERFAASLTGEDENGEETAG